MTEDVQRLQAINQALVAALRELADAVVRYGVAKDRSDEEWMAALNGVMAALRRGRAVIADAEQG